MQFKCQFRLLFHIYFSTFHFDGINFLTLRFSFASTFIIKKNLSFCSVHIFIFRASFLVLFAKKQWTLLLNKLFYFLLSLGILDRSFNTSIYFCITLELFWECSFITKISWLVVIAIWNLIQILSQHNNINKHITMKNYKLQSKG